MQSSQEEKMEELPNKQRLEEALRQQRELSRNLTGLEGMWVAAAGSEVVASAETLEKLLEQIDMSMIDGVWQVPRHRKLILGKIAVA